MRTFCLVVAVIAASAFDPASTGRVRLNPLRQSRNDAKTSFLHMQAPPTTLYDDYMKSRGMATRDASPMVDSPAVAAPETPAQPPAGKAAPTFNFLEFANTPKSDTDIDYERVPWWKQDSSFSETQRADRRTIFMHDDWVRHRSSERFLRNMMSIGSSGINQALRKELSFVTLTAVFVVVFNMLFVSYQDFSGISHLGPLHDFDATIKALSLPALPFSIAMPALSLLLVFRTNTAYFRWNEARTLWGGLINNCRNVVRQSNTFFRGPTDDDTLRLELYELVDAGLMTPAQADDTMAASNRPMFCLSAMSATLRKADIDPMHSARVNQTIST